MALSDAGLTVPRAADYLATMIATFKALSGVDLSTRPNNALYLIFNVVAMMLGGLAEAVQAVYDSRVLNNATGVQLDDLGQIKGVTRKPASHSTTSIVLTTTVNVPAGYLIAADATSQQWALADDANLITGLTTSGTATALTSDYIAPIDFTGYQIVLYAGTGASATPVTITSQTGTPAVFHVASWPAGTPNAATKWKLYAATSVAEPTDTGPIEAAADTLTLIVTTASGWTAVTNYTDAVPGDDIESDTDYRQRIIIEQPNNGARSPSGLRATLLAIDGISAAVVLSNPADTTQTVEGVSMSPHSGAVVVWPNPLDTATVDALALAIYSQISFGIATIGGETTTVYDSSGNPQAIHWDYASGVTVDVETTVVLAPGYTLDDVTTAVQDAVSTYLATLSVGDDVFIDRVEQAILNALPTQITGLDLTLNGGTSDIVIAGNEISQLGDNDVIS